MLYLDTLEKHTDTMSFPIIRKVYDHEQLNVDLIETPEAILSDSVTNKYDCKVVQPAETIR